MASSVPISPASPDAPSSGSVTASWLQSTAGVITVKYNVFHYSTLAKAREAAFELATNLDESVTEDPEGKYNVKDHDSHVTIVTTEVPAGQSLVGEGSFGFPASF
jgi:hypothetical protein